MGPTVEPSQEAHRFDLQVKPRSGCRGRQVVHVHYRKQVWVLTLEDEVCLMPASVFNLKIKITQNDVEDLNELIFFLVESEQKKFQLHTQQAHTGLN